MNHLGKKAIIEFSLVEESKGKANQEIVNEIFEELSKGSYHIPWLEEVKKVIVTEA